MINNIGIVPTLFDGFSDAAVVQVMKLLLNIPK